MTKENWSKIQVITNDKRIHNYFIIIVYCGTKVPENLFLSFSF